MAGGILFKSNQKPKRGQNGESNNEILKESGGANKQQEAQKEKAFVKHFLEQLQKEQQMVYDRRQMDVKKEIQELQEEIKKLKAVTNELNTEVEKAIDSTIYEYNEYQINFLLRIKRIINDLRKDICESTDWLACFNQKKKKKNCFWNNAKSKKGGSQYLQSGEHSASRSAN